MREIEEHKRQLESQQAQHRNILGKGPYFRQAGPHMKIVLLFVLFHEKMATNQKNLTSI